MKRLFALLLTLCMAVGMLSESLAETINLEEVGVTRWENGKVYIDPDAIEAIGFLMTPEDFAAMFAESGAEVIIESPDGVVNGVGAPKQEILLDDSEELTSHRIPYGYVGQNAMINFQEYDYTEPLAELASWKARFVQDFDGDGEITDKELNENVKVEWSDPQKILDYDFDFSVWNDGEVNFPGGGTVLLTEKHEGAQVSMKLTNKVTGATATCEWTIDLYPIVIEKATLLPETIQPSESYDPTYNDFSVNAGTEVSMTVNAYLREGEGELSYQWYTYDENHRNVAIEGANGPTYVFTPEEEGVKTSLWCIVKSPDGCESRNWFYVMATRADGQLFDMSDPVLYNAVYEQIKYRQGAKWDAYTMGNMVYELDLSNAGYTEIPDLSIFRSLYSLNLSGNPIDNLDALKDMYINTLDLSGTALTQLPREMYNVSELNIQDITIENLEEIWMENLWALSIGCSDRPLTEAEINLIKKNKGITKLNIKASKFDDWSFLDNIKELRELTLICEEPGAAMPDKVFDIIAKSDLDTLGLTNCGLSDLNFLEGKSLYELYLQGNEITDISVLASMTDMRELDISDNQISDLSPLKGMSLYTLRAANNQISDLSPLANMSNVTRLDLSGNQITSVKSLAKMKGMYELYLNSNQITDISALAKYSHTRVFELYDNPITESKAAAFKVCKVLTGTKEEYDRLDEPFETDSEELMVALIESTGSNTWRAARDCVLLNIGGTEFTDLPDLSAFKNLQALMIGGNGMTTLPEIDNLVSLMIGGTNRPLNEVEAAFIAQNTGLESLLIAGTAYPEIAFSKLKSLNTLTFMHGDGAEVDLSALSKNTKLETLSVESQDGQAILTGLPNFTNLKKLTTFVATNTTVSEELMTKLSKATTLQAVMLKNNGISDVTPLSKLTKLVAVWLNDNQITDVSPLYKLKKLEMVELHGNPIENPEEVLEKIPGALMD